MAVKTWQASAGVLSGNWSDAAHWTGGTLPANGDDVTLPALTGAYTVTLDTNTANLNSLALSSANATLAVGTNTVTISGNSASNAINLTGGGKITIAGGTISDSGGFNTGTNGTVTGKGFLTAGSYSGTGTLTASGGTLDVIGNIAVSTVKLAVANVAGSDLKIDGNSTVVQAAAVSISNANQTLEVASGSSLQVNAAQTVTNGTLKIDGTFTDAAGITLSNGTISGAGTVTATTGITGKGTVSLGLSTGNTVTASGGTLDLTGTIATGSGAPTLLIATAANSDLKIDSVATIAPVSITNANQTLEIGTGKSVTVTAPQNVTLGKILLDSGSTLTDASGITFGANGSANNGFLSGIGSVAADLSLAAGSTSTGSTITATGGGTLDLTGGIDTSLVLAISTTGTNTLKLDHDVTIQPVAISSSKQILEIGAGHSVAINAAQNVTGGTIKLNSGATLTDSNGITFGTNATATNGFLSGIGTVAANLSRATGSTSTGSKITALGGGTLDLTGTIGANLGLVIDSTAPNTLKIDSDSSVGAVTISSANQTLQIGTGHSVTISAAQTVTTGTLQVDGVLTDTAGITLASNGTLSGSGSVSSTTAIKGSGSLSLGLSTANTVTASGGTLDITGTIATGAGAPTLAIANTAGSVLKIDTDAAINAVTVTTANEKLQIGAGHNVTISGAQTISTGTLQVDGSLTDSNGITLTGATLSGAGSVSATTNVTGTGTISLGLSTANTVTASGGTLDITGAVGTLTAPTLAVATVAGSILKIDSDATIGAVSISSANQTLQIGSGHAVTIGATQTVASGKLQVDGTLTDTAGITLSGGTLSGSGSVSNTTNITGSGTISLNLSSTSNRVTASGGTLAVTGALTNVTALAVADVANSDLKIDSNATIGPVAIDASNKTLEVAAGRTVTIGAAQTVSLGKIQIDSGATLADAGGITLGSGSNNGFLQGLGTVTANLVRGDVSTGSTVTAVGGGTLDLQGTIDSALVLGISSAAANTLKIDSDSTIGAVSISSTNQTLQIGAGHSVTIGAAQTVTSGTLRIDGTVTDVSGITLSAGTLSGAGSVSGSTAITGKGTVSLGLSTANTVTASGGTLDLTGAIATGASAPLLAIATASASDLKIDSDVTIASVVINNANQTLEIGAGHSVTINAAQNITLGKILLDSGSTLTNSAGITFGTSGSASSGFLTGIGTVAANLSRATGSTSAGSTITAQGGGTLDLTGSIDSTLALAISTAAINTLKSDHQRSREHH